MTLRLIPIVVIGLLIVFVLPVWPWSRGWGWAPTGILGMGFVTLLLFQFIAIEPV